MSVSSATVLLGILPAALLLLGTNTPQISLLALRRPFLAFVLAVGTLGVAPTRALQYADHLELIERRLDVIEVPTYTPLTATMTSVTEYIFAFAAVANVVHITWQLCILTVCSFSPEAIYMPALWVGTSFLVNIGSYWASKLRTKVVHAPDHIGHGERRAKALRLFIDEFTLSSRQRHTRLKLRRETYLFIVVSWLTSLGAIGNLILGTLTLSGLQYIAVKDAMIVIARYLASAIVCRVVLNIEVAEMRATVDITESNRFRKPTMLRMGTMDSTVVGSEQAKSPSVLASGAMRYGGQTDSSFT